MPYVGVPPHKRCSTWIAPHSQILSSKTLSLYRREYRANGGEAGTDDIKDLLTEKDQNVYFAKFNVNGLLRGDIASEDSILPQWTAWDGWLNANDIRRLEEYERYQQEDGGDVYCVNRNYIRCRNYHRTYRRELNNEEVLEFTGARRKYRGIDVIWGCSSSSTWWGRWK